MTRTRWALLLLTPIAVALVLLSGLGRQAWYGRIGGITRSRDARSTTVTDLAPVPVPTALPLVGSPGRNAYGEPLRYVDRPAFRSLLLHGAHADLTRYLEQLQAEFEADPTREYWPIDAADAFASAEPELLARLDAWAAATPASFAPYLARAAHWRAASQARRGNRWAIETPGEDFSAMRDAARRGLADVDRALSIRPKLVAARRLQIMLLRLGDATRGVARAAIEQAVAACPTCFQVRVTYIFSLTPRWGGSYAAMDDFARASADPARPRLRLLAGYADHDRAWVQRNANDFAGARAAIGRAMALGDHWEFLLERAAIELADRRVEPALEALDRADALRPGHPDVLVQRARARAAAGRWEDAGNDMLAVLRADPTDATARYYHATIVTGLADEAWQRHVAGRREDALRLIALAATLAPTDARVLQKKAAIETGKGATLRGDETAALEQATRDHPDSFRVHRALDAALARERRFERIVEMWTAYLARHPNEGPAYLERGGAYYHMGQRAQARTDAKRACELGVSEGCAREKQIR